MDKTFLLSQLASKLREAAGVSQREMVAAADAAREGDDARTQREDSRMAIEYSALARGQARRAEAAQVMLAQVEALQLPEVAPRRIGLGSLVEIEDEDDGTGRTFFLAPAGAGIELEGPGGDGFFVVVTPSSPLGKAVMGQREGDSVDVTVDGETRSWLVTWVA